MAKAFTVQFSFEQKEEKALVYMYEKDYNILFKIHVFNEDLYYILPNGHLVFSFSEGLLAPQHLNGDKAQQLVVSITDNVAHYLDKEEQYHFESARQE